MPPVPSHIPQRMGRRAGLFSLQRHDRMEDGSTGAVPSRRQPPIMVGPLRSTFRFIFGRYVRWMSPWTKRSFPMTVGARTKG